MVTLVLQVLLCFVTGFLLMVVYGSSSWLVGKAEVNMSVGPQKPPVQGVLGVWAGLWHVNLTYETDAFTINERVDWTTRMDLVAAHKKSLSHGWPWALVSLTAELGGEGTVWRGQLGDGLRVAGLAGSTLLVAAMTVCAVWVLLFTVSPQVTARPIMLSGAIMVACSVVYVVCVSVHIPYILPVAGTKMELHLGYAWWATAALGFCLIVVGLGLLLYNKLRPGQLATVFEVDFGSPNHHLHQHTWKYSDAIFAFSEVEETYSQGYAWPHVPAHFEDTYTFVDKDKVAHRKKTKKSAHHASERQQESQTVADHQHIPCTKSSKKGSLSETQMTPDRQDDVECEEDVAAIMSVSTLEEGQDHTSFSPPPPTLRRRSPEQAQEHQSPPSPQEHNVMPLGKESDTAYTNTRLEDNHSTLLVEKFVPKTTALLRTPIIRSSMRKFSRVKSRLSGRLSYKSPLRWKSMSLSRLVLPSHARQDFDEETDGKDEEWVEDCEETVPALHRDSITRF